MADRVFLHVGAPKTGTSYLQRILWANKKRLRENGYLLPGSRQAHYQAMGDLRRGLWFDPDASWTWGRLASEAREFPGTVIISEEMLGVASREQAASALRQLQPADIHVIVACRDLWRSIPSTWQQGVRARSIGSFGTYVAGLQSGANPGFWASQWPVPIMERWCRDIPPENRHVITLPPPGADPLLLWERFSRVLGIEPADYETDFPRGNVSLGAEETELLRLINNELGDRFPLRAPYLHVVRRFLTQPVLTTRENDSIFGAPPEVAVWAEEKSGDLIAELRAYPCDLTGDLSDLIPRITAGVNSPDELSEEVLLKTAVEVIIGMLEHFETTVQGMEDDLSETRVRAKNLRAQRDNARARNKQLRRSLTELRSRRDRRRISQLVGRGLRVSRRGGRTH